MANFSEDKINAVWEKAEIVPNYDEKKYRKDGCGTWIARSQYGKETSGGWDIDHCFPISKGGDDKLDNLQALQWKNNRTKADDFPEFKSSVVAEGGKNIERELRWRFKHIIFFQKLYPNNSFLRKF